MRWRLSHRADPAAVDIADRHYNRQKPGTPQFVPPGRCMVLLAKNAVWTTSWPFAEYVKHDWGGAWINSLFRNEGKEISSELIREAVAATRWYWRKEPTPVLGMITFIDPSHVRPTMRHGKPTWGYCYIKAGFVEAIPRTTRGGLLAFQLLPADMPSAEPPIGAQLELL